MSATLALILVVSFAYVVSWVVKRYFGERWPLTGVEHLLVGVAVGPRGAGLLTPRVTALVQPFFTATMGLVGFIFGLPLRRSLGDRPIRLQVGLVVALVVAAAVGAVIYGVLFAWPVIAPQASRADALWLALAVGAAAAVVSDGAIEGAVTRAAAAGPATELIRACALVGNIVGVTLSGFSLAVARARQITDALHLTQTEWLVSSLGLGIACGVLFRAFIGGKKDDDRAGTLFVATVGVVVFASGMAAGMGLSPLLVSGIAGIVVSLLSRYAEWLYRSVRGLEPPAHIALAIYAGATWELLRPEAWLLAAAYLFVRMALLRGGAVLGQWVTPDVPRVWGLGGSLLPQGGLAAAVVLSFAQVNQRVGPQALAAVLPCLLVSDAAGAAALRRTLADAGETGSAGEAGPAKETR